MATGRTLRPSLAVSPELPSLSRGASRQGPSQRGSLLPAEQVGHGGERKSRRRERTLGGSCSVFYNLVLDVWLGSQCCHANLFHRLNHPGTMGVAHPGATSKPALHGHLVWEVPSFGLPSGLPSVFRPRRSAGGELGRKAAPRSRRVSGALSGSRRVRGSELVTAWPAEKDGCALSPQSWRFPGEDVRTRIITRQGKILQLWNKEVVFHSEHVVKCYLIFN